MTLDDAYEVEILLDFLHIDGHFIELGWLWPKIIVFDVEIEYVE